MSLQFNQVDKTVSLKQSIVNSIPVIPLCPLWHMQNYVSNFPLFTEAKFWKRIWIMNENHQSNGPSISFFIVIQIHWKVNFPSSRFWWTSHSKLLHMTYLSSDKSCAKKCTGIVTWTEITRRWKLHQIWIMIEKIANAIGSRSLFHLIFCSQFKLDGNFHLL